MIPLRIATPSDAQTLAMVHVRAWHETYAGIVGHDVLARLDVAERASMWGRRIAGGGQVLLAEDAAGIAGFGDCGPQRDASLPFPGEVRAIYVLRRAQRQGVGRRLMNAMARQLLDTQLVTMSLWVATPNRPARDFYELVGGRVVAHREPTQDGWPDQVAYGWDDLRPLAGAA